MCFSNLPIEFDEQGNPRLTEEAEDVDRPACGCEAGDAAALEELDPADAYDEIVASMPEAVRERLEQPAGGTDSGRERHEATPEAGD